MRYLTVLIVAALALVGCAIHRQQAKVSNTPVKAKADAIVIESLKVVDVINTNGQTAKRFTFKVSGCVLGSDNIMESNNVLDGSEVWLPIIVFAQLSEPYTFTRTIALNMVKTNTFFRVWGNPAKYSAIAEDVDPTCTLYSPIVYTNSGGGIRNTNPPPPPPMPTALRKVKR